MKINNGTVIRRRGLYSVNQVEVVKLERAIQSLKRAKKEGGAKYVIVKRENGELVLKPATGDQLLSETVPTPAQMKTLHLKVKKIAGRMDSPIYSVDESKETMAAILESSKDSYKRNSDFYSTLSLNIAER